MCYCLLWDDQLSTGEGQTTCGIYIIADTGGDKAERFSSQPTSWSIGEVLIFPCFIFFQVTTTGNPSLLEDTRLSYLRAFVNAVFSQNSLPPISTTLFQESSFYPPDAVSFFILFLAICLHIPQSSVNSVRACPSPYPQGLAYYGCFIERYQSVS